MKISRFKKSQRILNFYKNNYDFREPYQILIDGTFCVAALNNKIQIEEQLTKYLQSPLLFRTTQCIIVEAESLGPKVQSASIILKRFLVHKCGHNAAPKTGAACIRSMIKTSHYIIASQDRDLQEYLRTKPGQPILYLHQCTPVLEHPSDISKKHADKKIDKSIYELDNLNEKKLEMLKVAEGIPSQDAQTTKKKKFKKKQKNPLSCKKKKKKPNQQQHQRKGVADHEINKKKRIRMKKLAKHVQVELLKYKKS